ncbi:CubicO group peptidase, beta-lactamase class C family [Clostridium cavendishii DSM 21758]|uniref:CubicO group peptidase, beta-lactamase class C family n=1 Tax=Clostridium cavendishii DSM 21758 TaxID=1121302 RepID=A0A1M6HLK9_9CLOT|nr:serine hydrolase domain-containing protein [Clostridium cavendishii]SHJ23052.1 CubicO group peptidase, beta-lactamase class C family [Clostridium cavendishii DSM 21758]
MEINLIEEKINNIKEFSGVISIKKYGKVIYEKAYGFADIANERKNNINTRFGIASGAKLLTAISICKLVDEGLLKFDSVVKDYVELENISDNVTIKNLLTHTSGIPDYFDEEKLNDFSELWNERPMYLMREPKDFIPLMKVGKMMFNVGEKFHYNNGAFVILALIVEKVSGMKFVDFVKKNVFEILDMNQSGYFSIDMLPKNCAYGYEENKDGTLKTNIYSIPVVGGGDGGVFVTLEDISKLWNGLLNYRLLSKDTTDELLAMQVYVNYDVYYGYGIWIIKHDDGVYKYYITGSDPGVSFESAVYPKKGIEVTILGNREFSTYEIIKELEIYL